MRHPQRHLFVACATSALALIVSLSPHVARAQAVLSVATDRDTYAAGETIEVQVILTNPTEETVTLQGSSTCQAQFIFDDYDAWAHTPCTADVIEVPISPGASRTYTWQLDPTRMSLPRTSGRHTVVGYYPGVPDLVDTTYVEAEVYAGGQVFVGLAEGVTEAELQPLRDSLGVVVLDAWQAADGTTSEHWRYEGLPFDSLLVRYGSDPRLRYIEADDGIGPADVRSTATETPYTPARPALSVHPNPAYGHARLQLVAARGEVLRVALYDAGGRLLAHVHDGLLPPGTHDLSLPTHNLAAGTYFVRVEGAGFRAAASFVLLR